MLSYSEQRKAERKREATTRALRKYVKRACPRKRDRAKAIERGAVR
jgi:hypothetical protein